MLVLTRKTDQKIRIGSNITITICKIQGDQVSIGIEAPADQKIVRLELLDPNRKSNEKRAEVVTTA
jgi:carbon storage regulator